MSERKWLGVVSLCALWSLLVAGEARAFPGSDNRTGSQYLQLQPERPSSARGAPSGLAATQTDSAAVCHSPEGRRSCGRFGMRSWSTLE